MNEHTWMTVHMASAYLRPIFLVSGLVICCRNISVSRHMPFLIVGFGLMVADWLWLFLTRYSETGRHLYSSSSYYTSLLHPWAWAFVVVGLAQILSEAERRRSRTERRPEDASEVDTSERGWVQ